MRTGSVWEPTCSKCGKTDGSRAEWQDERPDYTPPDCGWCLAPGDDAVWEHSEIRPVRPLGRLSGFSRSDSDFTPHYNTAFGRRVGSLSEMKHLQAANETMDIGVSGDAAEKYVPRDVGRRFKHHREVREALDSGKPFEPERGVRVEFKEAGDA